jgi:hypothetical protein
LIWFFYFIQEKALIEAFEAPAEHPGCSGSRGLQDNLSDLKAQIAANQVGAISEFLYFLLCLFKGNG